MFRQILFILIIMALPVSAQAALPASADLTIKLSEDNSGSVTYRLSLENNLPNSIISEAKIRLPFDGAQNITVSIGEQDISYTLAENGRELNLDLAPLGFRSGETKELLFRFSVPKATYSVLQGRLFEYAGSSGELEFQTFKVQLEYPSNWGKPSDLSRQPVNSESGQVNTLLQFDAGTKPIMLGWATTSLTGIIGADFTVDLPRSGDFIVNVPLSLDGQRLLWTQVPSEATGGLYDPAGNEYLMFFASQGQKQHLKYSALLTLDYSKAPLDKTAFTKDLTGLPPLTNPPVLTETDQLKLLGQIFDHTLARLAPTVSRVAKRSEISELDQRVNSDQPVGPIEYCYLMSEVASMHGILSRYNYGLQLYPIRSEINSEIPHIWCEFLVQDQIYVADPYLSDLTGYRLLANDRRGKFVIGSFNFSGIYHPILDNPTQVLPKVELTNLPQLESSHELYIDDISSSTAGSVTVRIDNPTRLTHRMLATSINGQLLDTKTTKGFGVLILPGRVNEINYTYSGNLNIDSSYSVTLESHLTEITREAKLADGSASAELARIGKNFVLPVALIFLGAVALIKLTRRIKPPGSI